MRFEARHADSVSADELDGTSPFRGTVELMKLLGVPLQVLR